MAQILDAFDGELLAEYGCYFGGGTAISLRFGEFRESADIDLLVADRGGYGALRERVRSGGGINALTRRRISETRPPVTDQYGIRTLVDVDHVPIRIEIVAEGRLDLETPDVGDEICGVPTLTVLDMLATKLLANSDRWADRSVFSRDLIDMAMIEPSTGLIEQAVAKAETAYRSAVLADLAKAIDYHRENPHRLDECMHALAIDSVPKAVLWQRITRLMR
ncbi:nucleotidyl transferase AbiEii/AbiGii toxin family protein [Gordonia malaquae]|uniref:nucleotidyl transferase AbiEii/AbiGii toxin family protein n=1 Tax=Gordonia malaquae TaxID=410332 RepID=UPI003017F1BB